MGQHVEASSVPGPGPGAAPTVKIDGDKPGEKGLKTGALGFASSVVIGVASTAPGYSLASVLGVVVAVAGIGVYAPAVLIVAFLPMLFIAASYYYMNRADPDCGTTFSWVTRGMGPWWGWIGGWAIIVADIIVMANLAQVAGLYSFLLFGVEDPSTGLVTLIGVIWIAIMTVICVIGIELSARTQIGLLGAEILTLALFAVVALVKVYSGDALEGALHVDISWFNPFEISSLKALVAGLLLAVFIYWGWDSTVAVNEETEDSSTTPGRAALASTVILVLIYVLVAVAAIAYAGPELLGDPENADDVLGVLAGSVFGSETLGKIVIIAVLTSAAASTQTTILPTSRTALSMARAKAIPEKFGQVSPRYLTPDVATWWMGGLSIFWYVGLTLVSENILYDSIAALGLMIAFYYGITGVACVIYYRRELLKSVKSFLFIGVAPAIGSITLFYLLGKSIADLTDPANGESGDAWIGVAPPLVIGVGFMIFGGFLMVFWYLAGHREFFQRKAEVVDPRVLLDAGATPPVEHV